MQLANPGGLFFKILIKRLKVLIMSLEMLFENLWTFDVLSIKKLLLLINFMINVGYGFLNQQILFILLAVEILKQRKDMKDVLDVALHLANVSPAFI